MSEGNGRISRETATITGGNFDAGTVLGKITIGAATAALDAGATGNGTFSEVIVGAGAVAGVYTLQATSATKFRLEDPAGVLVGTVTVGTEFSKGGLTFTITAGGTAFAVGDQATITVAAGSGKYTGFDPDATDGSHVAVAVLFDNARAASADVRGVIVARLAEVKAAELVWPAGITDAQKTAALASLAAVNIIART